MNIKQVKYFVSVCRNGSLSAAAKEQYITVQAVSKAIADLERELGRDLFIRESRGVRPTPFGEAFFSKALPVLESFEDLEAFAHGTEAQGGAALRMALCTAQFYRSDHACASLASFASRHLGIKVSVEVEPLESALDALRRGEFDGLFSIGMCEAEDVNCSFLGTVVPGLVMAANHPLAAKRTISLDDMKKYPVVTAGNFDSFNIPVEEGYRARGIEVRNIGVHAKDYERLLFKENGMAFAAGVSALGQMYPGCVMRLVSRKDAVIVPLGLVSLKGRQKSSGFIMLERWLLSEVRAFGDDDSIKRIAALAAAGPRGNHS